MSLRALNRTLLDRQALLRRRRVPPAAMVEWLCGMQSQAPNPPYVGLWTRVAGFDPSTVSAALESFDLVRIAAMRGTVHLLTAADARLLRAAVQVVLERQARGQFAGCVVPDPDVVRAETIRLLRAQPRTAGELGTELQSLFPDADVQRLGNLGRALVPMVQLPPRGLWRRSGRAVHGVAADRIGPGPAEVDLAAIVARYLRAFGPASVRDAQAWSGLTGLTPLMKGLPSYRSPTGELLFDLPGLPVASGRAAVPVRFLPDFDNILLSHAVRDRIMAPALKDRVFTVNGIIRATVLVDGVVAALWTAAASAVVVDPLVELTDVQRTEVQFEGARLAHFLALPDGCVLR